MGSLAIQGLTKRYDDVVALDGLSVVLVERLCDRVAIIDRGHLVAHGTLAQLRASAPARRWVDVPNAAADWGEDIPGTHVVRREGARLLFEIDPGADDQVLLQAALATGQVREFHAVEPSLGEIFRAVLEEATP